MTKIPYTKESARKLWTEARDKYQNQLDSKTRKNGRWPLGYVECKKCGRVKISEPYMTIHEK